MAASLKLRKYRQSVEEAIAQIAKDIPENANAVNAVAEKFRSVFSACDPAIRFASTTTSQDGVISQVLAAAQSLSSDSNRLKTEVGKFLNTVRAA